MDNNELIKQKKSIFKLAYKCIESGKTFLTDYKNLVERGNGANKCVSCGACTKLCPQHIDIPSKLREAHQVLIWEKTLDICKRNGLEPIKFQKDININDKNLKYILVL